MRETIQIAISKALEELGLTEVDFSVEHPADISHGDYATNVAMIGAKKFGKNPRELAEELGSKLEGTLESVKRIEIAGPGFINFFLTRDFYTQKVNEILSLREKWGSNTLLKDEQILFEYTSPNLFKPLHIGNLVGNIIGESISRLFDYSGATVCRINYPSDIGLTVAKGVWGLKKTSANPDNILELGEAYRAGNEAYENDAEAKTEIELVNRALYDGTDNELSELRTRGIRTSKARLRELCSELGTTFDTEIFESEAGRVGAPLVRENVENGIFEESEGAIIFKGEKYGLHTRVFLNSQGLPTYEAKDLGNFKLKEERFPHWTQSFVVTGMEQKEYFKVIIAAIREVFKGTAEKVIEHIPTGFLTLTSGKMSSRKGNVLTGESLIADIKDEVRTYATESRADDSEVLTSQVAVAALKYQILRQSIGSNIVFDKARALSFEGDSGPYLQYTHARIESVIEKAKKEGIVSGSDIVPEKPYLLEQIIYRFSEIIEDAMLTKEPHQVLVFLTELASVFNTFYAHEKIVDGSDPNAPYKLTLATAVKTTLKNGLWVLGISAPEKM